MLSNPFILNETFNKSNTHQPLKSVPCSFRLHLIRITTICHNLDMAPSIFQYLVLVPKCSHRWSQIALRHFETSSKLFYHRLRAIGTLVNNRISLCRNQCNEKHTAQYGRSHNPSSVLQKILLKSRTEIEHRFDQSDAFIHKHVKYRYDSFNIALVSTKQRENITTRA